jgi:hypothetical protein
MPRNTAKTREKIPPRWITFAVEYAVSGNGTQAAKAAGYSPKAAAQQAYVLLRNPKIQALISEEQAERWKRVQMSGDEVLARLARLARSDVRKLFTEDGGHVLPHKLDDDAAFCVGGIETELTFGEDGAPPTAVRKYKLRDPTPALRVLAQYHKLIGAEVEVNITEELAERLAAARKRVRQVSVDKGA